MGSQFKTLLQEMFRLFIIQPYVMVVGIVFNFINFWFSSRPVPCPRMNQTLLLKPATHIANMIRHRKVSCVEVVEAFIARQKLVNPIINAVVATRYEAAICEARAIDQKLAACRGSELPRELTEENAPFLGVPATVKECFAVEGMPQTSGVYHRKGCLSTDDAHVVKKLRDAGAIILGVTNTSELCMWWETHNHVHGQTSNPYDPRRIVGGSSGGEGAIQAAAGSLLGIGSDIGGSLRMPAFFNGIFTHKSTPSTIINDGQFPSADTVQTEYMLTSGPLCRFGEDTRVLHAVLVGPQLSKELRLKENVDLSSLRYFSFDIFDNILMCQPVVAALRKAQFKAVHCVERVLKVKVNHVDDLLSRNFFFSLDAWSAGFRAESTSKTPFSDLLCPQPGKCLNFKEELLRTVTGRRRHTIPALALSLAEKITPDHLHARTPKDIERRDAFKQKICNLLGDSGVAFVPVNPRNAYFHHEPLFTPFNFLYTAIFNALGLPVTHVPLGIDPENGMPLGVQIVMTPGNDRLGLALAVFLERHLGGWVPPSSA